MSNEGWEITPKGLRVMIECFEYCMGYELTDTSKMKDRQLLKLFNALSEEADINGHPSRKSNFESYLSLKYVQMMDEIARNN
jgi:hypothetical protein